MKFTTVILIMAIVLPCLFYKEMEANVVCPPGQSFQHCLPACQRPCETRKKGVLCDKKCNRGCYCVPGTVLKSKGSSECVNPSKC
uniref:Serine protease inhibitor BMSI 2 n=1 Tax=Bombina microdeladigitora TaxID=356193 RepID=B1P2F9_9ANUR|nr:serine protease inhibitor BMSI 2 [Bombina microdeladigitora]